MKGNVAAHPLNLSESADQAFRRGSGSQLGEKTTRTREVREMLEGCYFGTRGEIEDREPVATCDGSQVLRCPECAQLDRLDWLPEDARGLPSRRRGAGNRVAA